VNVADPNSPLDPGAFLREQVAPRVDRRVAQLRADLAKLQRELDDRVAATATVQLILEGAGGGTWSMNLRDGQMHVAETPAAPPLVRVYQRREDWEALARTHLSGVPLGGRGFDLTRNRIDRLRSVVGTIEFQLTGETERSVRVQFGPGEPAPPRCIVVVGAGDFAKLQSGELAPQSAFLQGLVKVQGDMGFAMLLGTALLA
jgi:hypothetical protein